jgi:hypothetical protein
MTNFSDGTAFKVRTTSVIARGTASSTIFVFLNVVCSVRSSMSRFSENQYLALWQYWYWIRKLQARFFAGDYVAGVSRANRC